MAKNEPQSFGRYDLIRRIGAGGMGEVYLAREPSPQGDRVVVVKKILPHLSEDKGFVGRFQDEGKVVVHLDHENIARVFEMGEVEGQFFMAMEYVEGKTLAKVVSRLRERNYSFPLELALWIGAETCRGLHNAHTTTDAEGNPLHVVHRDVSPSNIMVTYDGAVKLIDFGAALSTLKEEMTAPRVVIGNLSYMAPEHARKQKVDQRADVFSVGVCLWELLAWQVIPSDGDPIERWKRAARPNFEKPSHFRPGLPKEIDAVVIRALAADPRDRFADAEEMQRELLAALHRLARPADMRKLGSFMRTLFDAECRAERQIVAEAIGVVGPTTGRVTAPFATDPGVKSDPLPPPLPISGDVTTPAMAALSVTGELALGIEERSTAPNRPALSDVGPLDIEATLPGRPLALDADSTVSTKSDRKSPGRRVERTPTSMPMPRSPYVWLGVGVAIGFALVGLAFAFVR